MRLDSHSSVASLLPNAGQRLVAALATLWDADGLPAVQGLDTGVRPPTDAQRAVVATLDLRELDDLREHQGLAAFNGGIEGLPAAERLTFEPTLNLQGLWSGHTDPVTPKTVIPAEAYARIDVRIVPDQVPDQIRDVLRRHLDEHGFDDVALEQLEGEPAWWTPPDHPLVLAAGGAAEDVTGQSATYSVSMAGTVPMFQVCATNRVPCTTLGAGRDDCDAHAPDENIRIEDLATATRMTARFLDRFAALPEVPKVP
jgi:acetylornithine deacetylase/succinyl-diaminopimelate desuccinylase-like protein